MGKKHKITENNIVMAEGGSNLPEDINNPNLDKMLLKDIDLNFFFNRGDKLKDSLIDCEKIYDIIKRMHTNVGVTDNQQMISHLYNEINGVQKAKMHPTDL
jgi:hypothetical protein